MHRSSVFWPWVYFKDMGSFNLVKHFITREEMFPVLKEESPGRSLKFMRQNQGGVGGRRGMGGVERKEG